MENKLCVADVDSDGVGIASAESSSIQKKYVKFLILSTFQNIEFFRHQLILYKWNIICEFL